jgi:hypothetical protein
MPNNILYALGFFLTIGKRSGKRRNRTCTDNNAVSPQKINETGRFVTRQPTDEHRFQRLLQRLPRVKMGGDGGEEIVDKFSGAGLSMPFRRPFEGLWTGIGGAPAQASPAGG